MRLIFTLLFSLLSLNAFALISDRSIELSRVLSENKVLPSGKRQTQSATAACDISRRSKMGEIECRIMVSAPGNFPNTVYEELSGEKAQELSALLSEFNIKPEGKHGSQHADILCRLPKRQLDQPTVCRVIDTSHF